MNRMTEEEIAQWIADTEQHVKDGLITRREADSKIKQIRHPAALEAYAADLPEVR